eukprot:Hpha_TRINITY_DN15471_c5_g9::TRINITY_DN15471_c5_g9_i1::g.176748::m.176748
MTRSTWKDSTWDAGIQSVFTAKGLKVNTPVHLRKRWALHRVVGPTGCSPVRGGGRSSNAVGRSSSAPSTLRGCIWGTAACSWNSLRRCGCAPQGPLAMGDRGYVLLGHTPSGGGATDESKEEARLERGRRCSLWRGGSPAAGAVHAAPPPSPPLPWSAPLRPVAAAAPLRLRTPREQVPLSPHPLLPKFRSELAVALVALHGVLPARRQATDPSHPLGEAAARRGGGAAPAGGLCAHGRGPPGSSPRLATAAASSPGRNPSRSHASPCGSKSGYENARQTRRDTALRVLSAQRLPHAAAIPRGLQNRDAQVLCSPAAVCLGTTRGGRRTRDAQ